MALGAIASVAQPKMLGSVAGLAGYTIIFGFLFAKLANATDSSVAGARFAVGLLDGVGKLVVAFFELVLRSNVDRGDLLWMGSAKPSSRNRRMVEIRQIRNDGLALHTSGRRRWNAGPHLIDLVFLDKISGLSFELSGRWIEVARNNGAMCFGLCFVLVSGTKIFEQDFHDHFQIRIVEVSHGFCQSPLVFFLLGELIFKGIFLARIVSIRGELIGTPSSRVIIIVMIIVVGRISCTSSNLLGMIWREF